MHDEAGHLMWAVTSAEAEPGVTSHHPTGSRLSVASDPTNLKDSVPSEHRSESRASQPPCEAADYLRCSS